jgi:hypothetical protein
MSRALNAQSAALTPLNAVPSTTAGFTLWNGESQSPQGPTAYGGYSSKYYVIDSVFVVHVVSQAVATNLGIWVCLHKGVQTKPTGSAANASFTTYGESPLSSTVPLPAGAYATNAVFVSGATVPNDNWTMYGNSIVIPNTANAFTSLDIPIEGYVLQPGFMFSMHAVVANTPVATSVQLGITWREMTPDRAKGALSGLV